MSKKQTWFLDRTLLPVGFLPPTINLEDFKIYENTRNELGIKGFEYFYILGQNFNDINSTVLADKIYVLHSPWQTFIPTASLPKVIKGPANFFLLKKRELSNDLIKRTEESLIFAKKIGARVIISHITFFDHHNLQKQLEQFAKLESHYKIPIAIEHDAPYIYKSLKKGVFYQKYQGSYDWLINPKIMSQALSALLPRKKFGICFDTASLMCADLDILESIKPIYDQIIHVHLATNKIGFIDDAMEVNDPKIVDFINFLYEKDYSHKITLEVHGAIGKKEHILAYLHTALAVGKINLLRNKVLSTAQVHLKNSCDYVTNRL